MGFETYSNIPSGLLGQNNISNMDFVGWVLGQFSTVDEVQQALNNVVVRMFDVSLFKKPFKDPTDMPHLHYHVVDKSGKAIVIEFVDGKAKVFPSVGAVTNNPTYDWQVTNLRNYVGLQTKNFMSTTFMGQPYAMLSNGTGGIGLPGDFTSTSRFIRAMYFLDATVSNNKIGSADEAIARSFRILNQFDIPEGSVVETKPDNPSVITTKEATSWTSMADLNNLRYYYHTMQNRTVRMVELRELLKMPVTRPVVIDLPKSELIVDETGSFMLQGPGK
jgi:choloylglycine hydrolase